MDVPEKVTTLRTLLYGKSVDLEDEITTRVLTYVKFMETVEEHLEPLTIEQENFVKLGALLGARCLHSIIGDACLSLIAKEELETVMDYVDKHLEEKRKKKNQE